MKTDSYLEYIPAERYKNIVGGMQYQIRALIYFMELAIEGLKESGDLYGSNFKEIVELNTNSRTAKRIIRTLMVSKNVSTMQTHSDKTNDQVEDEKNIIVLTELLDQLENGDEIPDFNKSLIVHVIEQIKKF